jgi:hypothetical protein
MSPLNAAICTTTYLKRQKCYGPDKKILFRGRIGTRFLRPRGTSPLKGVNHAGTPGYRNGTKSFFGLKGRPSVVRDVEIHNQPVNLQIRDP